VRSTYTRRGPKFRGACLISGGLVRSLEKVTAPHRIPAGWKILPLRLGWLLAHAAVDLSGLGDRLLKDGCGVGLPLAAPPVSSHNRPHTRPSRGRDRRVEATGSALLVRREVYSSLANEPGHASGSVFRCRIVVLARRAHSGLGHFHLRLCRLIQTQSGSSSIVSGGPASGVVPLLPQSNKRSSYWQAPFDSSTPRDRGHRPERQV